MFRKSAVTLIAAGAAAMGLGAASLASAPNTSTEGFSCEIRTIASGGMITIDGVLQASRAVGGTYGFRVAGGGSGGSSTIQQGGEFSARAGEEVVLGNVMLGARGARYDVVLTVEAGGRTLRCEERVGSI